MATVDPARIAAVRRFSRFYTRRIGVLQEGLLASPFSLAEGRVLYELAQQPAATARDLARELGMDTGYLSRILAAFEKRGLVRRATAQADARQRPLTLTAEGRRAFASLDRRSAREVGALLAPLPETAQARLTGAMAAIEALLAPADAAPAPFVLRPHRPGDMGWVVAKHGEVYAQEYGWGSTIEAITAEIVGGFLKNFDAKRERCWIAEIAGEPVGSVFLVRDTDEVARIRLLILDPKARGLGIGRDLVERSIAFAREAGYSKITLWTHAVLTAARAIYERQGFRLTRQWVHEDFGKPMESETWELIL